MQTENGKNDEEKNEIAHGAIVNELNRNRIGQVKRNIPARKTDSGDAGTITLLLEACG
ncbi:MAG: hypothetical protein ABFE02_18380 [Sulfuricella sp.]